MLSAQTSQGCTRHPMSQESFVTDDNDDDEESTVLARIGARLERHGPLQQQPFMRNKMQRRKAGIRTAYVRQANPSQDSWDARMPSSLEADLEMATAEVGPAEKRLRCSNEDAVSLSSDEDALPGRGGGGGRTWHVPWARISVYLGGSPPLSRRPVAFGDSTPPPSSLRILGAPLSPNKQKQKPILGGSTNRS